MKLFVTTLFMVGLVHTNALAPTDDDFTGNIHIIADTSPIQILETGDFHAVDLGKIKKDGWLAIVCYPQGDSLRPALVQTKRTHDEVIDESDATAKSGLRISSDVAKPMLLIRGLHTTQRNITTIFINRDGQQLQGTRTFALNDHKYTLQLITPKAVDDGVIGPGSRVVLESSEVHQTIASFTKGGDRVEVIWAGDLDNDGRLDLYLNVSGHYNISNKVLYLSSRANSSELVRPVAKLTTTGC